jgi:hypothetical protein
MVTPSTNATTRKMDETMGMGEGGKAEIGKQKFGSGKADLPEGAAAVNG